MQCECHQLKAPGRANPCTCYVAEKTRSCDKFFYIIGTRGFIEKKEENEELASSGDPESQVCSTLTSFLVSTWNGVNSLLSTFCRASHLKSRTFCRACHLKSGSKRFLPIKPSTALPEEGCRLALVINNFLNTSSCLQPGSFDQLCLDSSIQQPARHL